MKKYILALYLRLAGSAKKLISDFILWRQQRHLEKEMIQTGERLEDLYEIFRANTRRGSAVRLLVEEVHTPTNANGEKSQKPLLISPEGFEWRDGEWVRLDFSFHPYSAYPTDGVQAFLLLHLSGENAGLIEFGHYSKKNELQIERFYYRDVFDWWLMRCIELPLEKRGRNEPNKKKLVIRWYDISL